MEKNLDNKDKPKKKISVITPSLNSEKYIERAILSVLNQGYSSFEHIVIDGDSNDNTINILKNYPHLKWISEKDLGQADAMNKGFKLSTGDIIVYLNTDDYFYENIFHTINEVFESSSIDIVFGNIDQRNSGNNIKTYQPSIKYTDILEHWKILFPINPIQYFYKRELQEKTPFNINNHLAMDHEFLLSICKNARIKKINKTFGLFDMVDGSKTKEGTKEPEKYWTNDNFGYIDNFLKDFNIDYIIDFKKKQYNFFLDNITYKINYLSKKISIKKQLNQPLVTKLLNTLKSKKQLIIYGASDEGKFLYFPLKDKIAYYIDKNAEEIKTIYSKKVYPLWNIKETEIKTIVVSAIGYKNEIIDIINELNKNIELVFLEDFLDV